MEKKPDGRRVKMTKRLLKESLIELMKEKSIHSINIKEICEGTALTAGGRAEYERVKFLPYRINNPILYKAVYQSAAKRFGEDKLHKPARRGLGGEDFGFLSRKKPCAQFRVGVKPVDFEGKMPPAHNDHFWIDNGCFEVGIKMFTGFVLDSQDGIEGI